MKKIRRNRKGFVFTLDAVIALILLVSVFLFATQLLTTRISSPKLSYEQLYYSAADSMEVMSELRTLDLIGTYWVDGLCTSPEDNMNCTIASKLANLTLSKLLPSNAGFRLKFEDYEIFSSSGDRPAESSATVHAIAYRLASGYQLGEPFEGFVARATLSNMNKRTNVYAYFGGFVGQGNLTRYLELPSDYEIENVSIEFAAGDNFSLYINGINSGTYNVSGTENMSSEEWTPDPAYYDNFQVGNNSLEIWFTGDDITKKYIAGGFIRVMYNTSQFNPGMSEGKGMYDFPGINGLINLYSSFYVPGALNNMHVHLHFYNNVSVTTYLTIGNKTVYNTTANQTTTVDIPDSNLSAVLDYSSLSDRTIPVRLGIEGELLNLTGNGTGDAIPVTDVSGSMQGEKLEAAIEADKLFVDILLNISGNRVGLVSYATNVEDTHDLSTDKESLHGQIEEYTAGGRTCICCGINEARDIMDEQSNASRKKSMVVMSDGMANERCTNNYCEWTCWWFFCWWDCEPDAAKLDAIDAACEAYNTSDITVHAVAFGEDADEETLQAIAECGHGSFYYSDISDLAETYRKLAEEIIEVSYLQQTANVSLESIESILYPDSYILYNYTSSVTPLEFGNISITTQTERFGGEIEIPYKNYTFELPKSILVVDSKTTSYSSAKWTDRLRVKNSTTGDWWVVYLLSDYYEEYDRGGDPYLVQIPPQFMESGKNFTLGIGTGLAPDNATGGSPHDRVIYTFYVSESVGYGEVFFDEADAREDAQARLQEALTQKGIDIDLLDIIIQSTGVTKIPSLWGPSRFTLEVWR